MSRKQPITVSTSTHTAVVHPLTAGQYRRLVQHMRDTKDAVAGDFMMLSWSVKDQDGSPIYPTPQDAEGMSIEDCGLLLPACLEANGFGQDDQKKSGSEPTPSN